MAGWGWQSVHDPEVLPLVLQRWNESIRTGNPFDMEFPIRGADGQYRWFLTRVNAVRDRLGHVVRWFGTNTDVDQVKRVQQALRDESNVLELLNSTGSALARQRDLRSLLQTVTDAATGISGARFGAFFYHGSDSAGEPFTLSPPSARRRRAPNWPPSPPRCRTRARRRRACARTTSPPTPRFGRRRRTAACRRPCRRCAATWRCRWWRAPAKCWAG